MAGPWFTVQRENSGWQKLDTIWISNYGQNAVGRVELRVSFDMPDTRFDLQGAEVSPLTSDAAPLSP